MYIIWWLCKCMFGSKQHFLDHTTDFDVCIMAGGYKMELKVKRLSFFQRSINKAGGCTFLTHYPLGLNLVKYDIWLAYVWSIHQSSYKTATAAWQSCGRFDEIALGFLGFWQYHWPYYILSSRRMTTCIMRFCLMFCPWVGLWNNSCIPSSWYISQNVELTVCAAKFLSLQ